MQSRITITIPSDLVEAADARARSLDRSRSWVLVEALRRYLGAGAAVSEPRVAYQAGIGTYRRAQLEADLSLSPEQRVKEAQRTALAVPRHGPRGHDQLLTFDTYEDYLQWQRRQAVR
jgi:hypothetical protein